MKGQTKVTIVVLTYCQEQFVENTLRSVLNQDWDNLEIIIADDCSTDNTLAVIDKTLASIITNHTTHFLKANQNQGLVANWNNALSKASGEIIIAAGGDDIMELCRVRHCVEFFEAHPTCTALVSNCRTIDAEGRVLRDPYRVSTGEKFYSLDKPKFGKRFIFNGAAAAYRASVVNTFGPIDPRCGCEDAPLSLRAELLGKIYSLPAVLVSWRRHKSSVSFLAHSRQIPALIRRRAMLNKYRGAFYEALQAKRDIALAIKLGLQTSRSIRNLLGKSIIKYHNNRFKYHQLHPSRRRSVMLTLIGRMLVESELSIASRCLLLTKCSLKYLLTFV